MHFRFLFTVFAICLIAPYGRTQFSFGEVLDVDTTRSFRVDVRSNAFYHASNLKKEFTSFFVNGGVINDDLIERSYNNLKSFNTLGGNFGSEIDLNFYKIHFGKQQNLAFSLRLANNNIGALGYSKDLFSLAFRGNAPSLGDTLDFNGTTLNYQSYNKIGVGLISRKSASSFHVNFITSNAFGEAYLRNAELYTSPNGDSLNLDMDASASYSENNALFEGYGIGLDFNYNMRFGKPEDKFKGVLSFTVKDLGFVYSSEVNNIDVLRELTFEGATFQDARSIFNKDAEEILDTLGISQNKAAKLRMLPAMIEVAKRVEESRKDKWQSFFGVRLYPNLASVPLAYAGAHLRINQRFSAGAQLSYGGFGGLRAGVYTRVKWSKLHLHIASRDLLGLVSKQGRGNALQIGLSWYY